VQRAASKPAPTMTRPIRVAALQLRAHDRADFRRAHDTIVAALDEAAASAELVVLPEGTFPAYVLGNERVRDEPSIAETIERLCSLARATGTVIVAGAAVDEANAIRNGALVIDRDGSLAGRADKLFLWHFDRLWFENGAELAPIRTALGTLGVLICADGRIPTIARALVDRGAELLVMPTAWVTSGRNPDALENVQADLLARVRAFENGVPFIAANKCGSELGMLAYCGKSQIIDAGGEIVAIASQRDPQMLQAVVECGRLQPHRAPLVKPASREAGLHSPVRIAISMDTLSDDAARRLRILDDAFALAPNDSERFAALDRVLPAVVAADDLFLDPGGLVGYRRAGYRIAVWSTVSQSPWIERIARARALELRLYVVVFDAVADRAYAVDPDGTVIAGTFDGYRMASFVLDPRKTSETEVAPGTDIVEGLERIAGIVESAGVPAQ
jgi:predicted amidohydrolase